MSRVATVFGIALILAGASSAGADDMERIMQLWCTQAGVWTGDIDVTAADGKALRLTLESEHSCTENAAHHVVRERFGSGASTLKVTFIDRAVQQFHTAYFTRGKEAPYLFSAVSVEGTDNTHWKTIIASVPGSEMYEGRPAILRYIRVRNGDVIESWKDVQLSDGTTDFSPRSKIVQHLAAHR